MTTNQSNEYAAIYKTQNPGKRERDDIQNVKLSNNFIDYSESGGILCSADYFKCVKAVG